MSGPARGSLTVQLQRALGQALRRSNGGGQSQVPTGVQQRQVATLAYLEDVLMWDESGFGDQCEMELPNLHAYQALHSELATLIGQAACCLEPQPDAVALQPPAPAPADADADALQQDLSMGEVTNMLLDCAAAVAAHDVSKATESVNYLRRYTNPAGSPLQRMTHYFVEALVARLHGTGPALYAVKGSLYGFYSCRAYQLLCSKLPLFSMAYQFTNSVLLDAFSGARRVHVISYGILNGRQWPSFIRELVYRPGGPPELLRITGIEFPQPSLDMDDQLKRTGERLSKFAASVGIRFEFQGFAEYWEDVQVSSLRLHRDEVLAVCCTYRLRHLPDSSVVPSNPRRIVLERIRSMNPKAFVTGVNNCAANDHFLVNRIPDAVGYMANLFDSYGHTLSHHEEERLILERDIAARIIINFIACEGLDRTERGQSYRQWHRLLKNTGFKQIPLQENWFQSTAGIMEGYHQDFTVGRHKEWILHGWKERILWALGAWKPAQTSR